MSGRSDDRDFVPDLGSLGSMGDPFADEASAPPRAMAPPPVPAGEGASPTRSRVRASRRIAFVAALVFEVAFVIVDPHRRDLASASPLELAVGLAIPLTAAGAAFMAATRRGARGMGLSAGAIATLALTAPVLFALATLVGAPAVGSDPRFWRHAEGCAAVTSVLALGPMALGLWSFRRAFAVAAAWRTAALGVAAGALAAAAMSLACPLAGAWHVILGHGTMMLAAGLAGAWLAPAVSRS
jgi:hypothetical protein